MAKFNALNIAPTAEACKINPANEHFEILINDKFTLKKIFQKTNLLLLLYLMSLLPTFKKRLEKKSVLILSFYTDKKKVLFLTEKDEKNINDNSNLNNRWQHMQMKLQVTENLTIFSPVKVSIFSINKINKG